MPDNVTPIDRSKEEVNPQPKGTKAPPPAKATGKAAKAPAAKAAKATKAKAPAAKKAAGNGVVRTASTVSKEGTQKDEFTGEVLPVTSFPTVRNSDGSYSRGTVARKNLDAWRASKKADREAAKAAAEKAKAEKATKKAAAAKG